MSAISRDLAPVMRAMRRAGLEQVLADLFGDSLIVQPLEGEAAQMAVRLALLSDAYQGATAQQSYQAAAPDPVWTAVANGQIDTLSSNDPIESAIISAFDETASSGTASTDIEQQNFGAAALAAMAMLEDGANTDPALLEDGLRVLRLVGFEDAARKMALFVLLSRT